MGTATFTSVEYRRCARRLRHAHRDDPLRRARALRELSNAYDAARSAHARRAASFVSGPVEPVGAIDRVRAFAQRVADQLDGSVLRYSNRVALLHDARRHGLRRFDANLVIAAVQERAGSSAIGARGRDESKRTWRSCAAAFVLIQGLILAGATYVITS